MTQSKGDAYIVYNDDAHDHIPAVFEKALVFSVPVSSIDCIAKNDDKIDACNACGFGIIDIELDGFIHEVKGSLILLCVSSKIQIWKYDQSENAPFVKPWLLIRYLPHLQSAIKSCT